MRGQAALRTSGGPGLENLLTPGLERVDLGTIPANPAVPEAVHRVAEGAGCQRLEGFGGSVRKRVVGWASVG